MAAITHVRGVRRAALLLGLWVMATAASGQEAPERPLAAAAAELGIDLGVPLNLQQCVALAIAVHPDITAALARLRASKAAVDEARAALFPTLQLSADYSMVQQPGRRVQTGGQIITVAGGRVTDQNQRATLQYVFWRTGRSEGVWQARHYLEAAEAARRDAERRLEYEVAQAYFGLLAARRLAQVAQDQVNSWQEHIDMVQARIDAGDAATVDIYPVRADQALARLQLIQANNSASTAATNVRVALGSAAEDVVIEDTLAPPSEMLLLDEAVRMGLAYRPDLQQLESNVDAARLSVKLARLDIQPSLTVTGQAEYGRYNDLAASSWGLYGQLSYPVFDGHSRGARLEQARANLGADEAQLEAARLAVRAEVETNWLAVREATERIAASQEAVVEAQAGLDAARGSYEADEGIIIEVNDAQVRLNSAQVDAVRALYDYHIADAAVTQAIGGMAVRVLGPPE